MPAGSPQAARGPRGPQREDGGREAGGQRGGRPEPRPAG